MHAWVVTSTLIDLYIKMVATALEGKLCIIIDGLIERLFSYPTTPTNCKNLVLCVEPLHQTIGSILIWHWLSLIKLTNALSYTLLNIITKDLHAL